MTHSRARKNATYASYALLLGLVVVFGYKFRTEQMQGRVAEAKAKLAEERSKEAEVKAKLAEDYATALNDAMPAAMFKCDDQAIVTYCNYETTAFLGWLPKDLIGRPLSNILPEEFAERHKAKFAEFITKLRTLEGNWQVTRVIKGEAYNNKLQKVKVTVRMRAFIWHDVVTVIAIVAPDADSTPATIQKPLNENILPDTPSVNTLLPKS